MKRIKLLEFHADKSRVRYPRRCVILRRKFISLLSFGACVSILLPGSLNAQAPLPENAAKSTYGKGWGCLSGYKAQEEECVAIQLPENAYLNGRTYGAGWDCLRGFFERNGKCQPVTIPENAYLDSTGTGWSCVRGYAESFEHSCRQVIVPQNAHLTARGDDWECDFPYRAVKGVCLKPVAPDNAHLNHAAYGNGWQCDRGYVETNETCSPINLPQNAYLTGNTYDGGWECERGYKPLSDACVPLMVPENAHLNYSGNDWECDQSFRRDGANCVLN